MSQRNQTHLHKNRKTNNVDGCTSLMFLCDLITTGRDVTMSVLLMMIINNKEVIAVFIDKQKSKAYLSLYLLFSVT